MKPIEELSTLILMILFGVWMLNVIQGHGWDWIKSKFFTSYETVPAAVKSGNQTKVKPS
jgi:membrane associated rhomboid family serine protease